MIPTAHCGYDPVVDGSVTALAVWDDVEEDVSTGGMVEKTSHV